MVKITWTQEAIDWLDRIYAYIAADSPAAAGRVLAGIYKKTTFLKKHPRLGWRYETAIDREVRVLIYGHYRIAYLIRTENLIEILGVFHAAMEMEKYLPD